MSTHKHIDKICCVVLALTLIITVLFMNGEKLGIQKASSVMKYESTLFDTSKVHTIDIVMDDWEEFTDNCRSEEYYDCTVVIDNEAFKNIAIRGKGNTSLSSVTNDRYSYKIEFDHYDSTNTYHGLDKLCLNNVIQDNTYMKDYLTYQMMRDMGAASPLCSFVYITINGQDWGLYLAVEAIEESFLQRNYGKDYGELYKPDSLNMGGGRGNGGDFNMDDFLNKSDSENSSDSNKGNRNNGSFDFSQIPDGMTPPSGMDGSFDFSQMPDGMTPPNGGNMPQMPNGGSFDFTEMPEDMTPPTGENDSFDFSQMKDNMPGGFGGFGMGSSEVKLQYIDDNISSYSDIFDSAKTDITKADKTRLIESLKKLSNGEDLDNTVDVEAVIKYFVVHNFVVNADSYTGSMIHNYYLYEKDGQLQMLPWDYNLAFGSFMSSGDATSSVNDPIDTPLSVSGSGDRPMIDWIFSNEEYTELYHQYFSEFIAEYFDNGYFEEMIDSTIEMISPYVEKDPTKFCTYEGFLKGAETLKQFCLLRSESVNGQLDGKIGSTSATQEKDTLVDASHIKTSDMGSMGGGMGRPGSSSQDKTDKGTDKDTNKEEESTTEISTEPTTESSSQPDLPEQGNGDMPQLPEGVTPPNGMDDSFDFSQMPEGMTPPSGMDGSFDFSQMPEGMTPPNGFDGSFDFSQMPEGMTPPNGMDGSFDFSQMPEGMIPPNGGNMPPMPNMNSQGGTFLALSTNTAEEETSEFNNGNRFPQGDFNGQMQRPDDNSRPSTGQSQFQPQSSLSVSSLVLMFVSILVLLAGLVFAFTFKRRK